MAHVNNPNTSTLKTVLVAAFVLLYAFVLMPSAGADDNAIDGSVIVKFKPGTDANDRIDAIKSADSSATTVQRIPQANISLIDVNSRTQDKTIDELLDDPTIENVYQNKLMFSQAIPNDPLYNKQWQFSATAGISAEPAWDITTGDSGAATIAVLDGGFDTDHPDLAGGLWVNPGEIAGDGLDNDSDGYIDDVNGVDIIGNDGDPRSTSTAGHATHVAGIIAARGNNGLGVAGVSWSSRIMPITTLDPTTGIGSSFTMMKGIIFASNHGARIINASLGGDGAPGDALDALAKYASDRGILFVAAAGNAGKGNYSAYPAASDAPNVLSVAAIDMQGNLSAFSNWSPTLVDIAAPGEDILSIYNRNEGVAYDRMSGTSMATPMVSGAAALYLAKYPTASAIQIKNAILASVDILPSLTGKVLSSGKLNVARLLDAPPVEPAPKSYIKLHKEKCRKNGRVILSWKSPMPVVQGKPVTKYDIYVDGRRKREIRPKAAGGYLSRHAVIKVKRGRHSWSVTAVSGNEVIATSKTVARFTVKTNKR